MRKLVALTLPGRVYPRPWVFWAGFGLFRPRSGALALLAVAMLLLLELGDARAQATPNRPPSVTVTPQSATLRVGISLTLDGTASDLDGDPLSHIWSAYPDIGAFGNREALDTTWTAPVSAGDIRTVTLTLSVSDGTTTVPATIEATILDLSIAPTVTLATWPDRFPSVTGDDSTRTIFVDIANYNGRSTTSIALRVDGTAQTEAAPSTFASSHSGFAGASTDVGHVLYSITGLTSPTQQGGERAYEIWVTTTVGDDSVVSKSEPLRIEWRGEKPLVDFAEALDRLPGGPNMAAFIIPVGLALAIAGMSRSPIAAGIAFFGAFGLLAVLTPVSPLLWLVLILAAAGGVLGAFALGYRL